MPRKKEPTFEEALARLQDIVEKMEQGDLPLKDLIAQYSEGMKLMDLLVQEKDGEAVTSPLKIEEEP